MSLSTLLNNKQCFKLVCGAGNEDPSLVEKLVAVYSLAGTHYFDLSPNVDVVLAAQNGIKRVIKKQNQKDYFLNVSVGIKGDPHVRKAIINLDKCKNCGACSIVCLQKAIKKELKNNKNQYSVIDYKCIGCGACEKACKFNAIEFYFKKKDLGEILPPLTKLGLASIELHAITEDEEEAYKSWKKIESLFPGILSLCLDRSHLGDLQLINRIKRFIENRKDFSTIIQADGSPMSGSNDDNNTTLQTIATADIVQKAKLPVWILMSGGTNSKTTKLAKLFDIEANGVSLGSYARKIIEKEINDENFFKNKKIFNSALKKAKKLVDVSLKYLNDNSKNR